MTGTNRLRATQVLTLPEQIAAQVRESILDGSLGPGDRLPSEQAMAEMYGCSRPTVREAMRTLRADRILTSARGRGGGYRVAELGSSVGEVISLSLGMKTLDYAQLFAVRFDLELRSAATAATERTEADLAALRATLPADPAELPVEAALSADVSFHRALAEASHNPLLVGFAGATSTAFRRFSEEVQEVDPPRVLDGTREVVEAVAAQDPDASREAMRRHLAYFSRYFGLE